MGQRSGYSSDLVSVVMRCKGQGQDNLDKKSLSVSPSFLYFPSFFSFSSREGRTRGYKVKDIPSISFAFGTGMPKTVLLTHKLF